MRETRELVVIVVEDVVAWGRLAGAQEAREAYLQ
jgi:hypothetical protein